MTLAKQPAKPRHPNLVFSSVGDQSNCHRWLRGRRNFDLWVTYYGARPGSFLDIADYYEEHRGSKYQNLHHAYRQWSELLDRYATIFVLDDDIIISGTQISRLFEIRARLDLWALQPAFSPLGKISWPITQVDRTKELRFTNFIEMSCPLFRKDKLDAFMAVYDPELIGWGCDWWFLEAMGSDLRGRVAVVDAVPCVNPRDSTKAAGREIDRFASTSERREVWARIREKYQIRSESRGVQEYGVIVKPLLPRYLGWLADALERGWLRVRTSQRWPVRLARRLRSRARRCMGIGNAVR